MPAFKKEAIAGRPEGVRTGRRFGLDDVQYLSDARRKEYTKLCTSTNSSSLFPAVRHPYPPLRSAFETGIAVRIFKKKLATVERFLNKTAAKSTDKRQREEDKDKGRLGDGTRLVRFLCRQPVAALDALRAAYRNARERGANVKFADIVKVVINRIVKKPNERFSVPGAL
jgi:hypothetical protein